jgi:ubiquinone/menaquinone biosynthesis C-methylase UbiE
MPTTQVEFWSNAAARYDDVVDEQIGPRTRSLVRERLATEGRLGKIAEFGCGTGFFTTVLAELADHLVATDISPVMLERARERVRAGNVTFQVADCQRTPLPDAAFDTAFLALVLQFTEPERAISEMRRILRLGGLLLVANLDPTALRGLDRLRARMRILYEGLSGYRMKPPPGFGRNILAQQRLCELLRSGGFEALGTEVFRDESRTSHIPVQFVRARRMADH